MATDFNERARRLRNAVELMAAGVYFAPEAYEALECGGSPITADGVARPKIVAYVTTRTACLGQVPGDRRSRPADHQPEVVDALCIGYWPSHP